ncbi:hypothetical protein evm_001630 [Chilo suppressalis]|nr:hypothetical protein evm_001630 [Chilo suppressalis]
MPLPSKVDKENFRLLDLSSDEESEDLHLEIIPSRKKKVTRRDRNRGSTPKVPEPSIGSEVRCALRWAVRGTLLLWLLMLTWICATLYDQVSVMRMDIAKVPCQPKQYTNGNLGLSTCMATTPNLSLTLNELKI